MNENSAVSEKPNSAPKRVCMISYSDYVRDGRVRQEAETLVRWGYEVLILVPKKSGTPRTFSLCGVEVQELNIREYAGKSKLRYLASYFGFVVLAFIRCTQLFFQSRVGVVHVHNMPNVVVFAGLVPWLFGRKIILDVHDTVLETYVAKFGTSSRLLLRLLRLDEIICYSFAHKLICVNHTQRAALITRGVPGDKIVTVITMPQFASSVPSCRKAHQNGSFRMVNHGTISKRLGNDLIVRAASKLVHEIPGFELHIIGDGDDLDEVVRLRDSLGLQESVQFHGVVQWDKLPEKLAAMDVGVVANRINIATALMLPSKLIDYVVLSIPAIVPKLTAIEYYFSPDMVSYFEPENVDSLVEAAVNLYRDKSRRETQPDSAKSFLEKYQWESAPDGLRSLYEEVFRSN